MFAGLSALTRLQLDSNGLAALPAGVFDDLGALTTLRLNSNSLTALPAGVFEDLSALTMLRLDNNGLAALPDGVFEDLSALTTLNLSGNSGAPFAPTAVAAPADPATVLPAGGTVTLAGSAPLSGNPWGANVAYEWDLTNPAGVTVTFANAMAATTTVTIPPQTAGTVLTFTLGVAGRASAASQTATTTVTVTETPTVTLALSDASISENGAASTVTATVSPASATAFTVTVSAAAVSPAVAADFNLSTNKILSFATNATTSTGTVTITSVNNDVDAADKTVTVSGAVTASGVTAPPAVTLTIEDDDAPPVISDTVLPVLAADGLTLTLTYNKPLKVTAPAPTAFPVKATPASGSEGPLTVDTVNVSGSTVALTLAAPAAHDDAVTVEYVKPGSGDVVEDAAGNDAASFSARAVTNNSAVPRVTIEALHTDATPGIANPEFRVIRSNTAATALEVDLTVTQAVEYLGSTTQTITIAANDTMAEKLFLSTLFDSNVSGNLALAVAGDADHLPGVTGNAATVAMKLPAAGSILALEYGQTQGGWTVVEGETLDLMLTATLAANVARPRTDNVNYALSTEADTATINVDYTHTAGNLSFPAAGWTGAGTGANPYTQTRTFSVTTLEDAIYEGAEQFSVTVIAGSGNALPFTTSSVPVTLTDNETLMLTGVSLTSTPAMGAYYRAGETITVTAAFNGNVTVDTNGGTPQFGLDLGAAGMTALRQAAYASGTGTQALVFSYTVVADDDDPDGVSWAANSLGLGGGAIHFTSTAPAARVAALITHGAGAPAAAHKVDAAAPVFASAAVDGTALTITFNEDLAAAGVPGQQRLYGEEDPVGRCGSRRHPVRHAVHQRQHGEPDPGRGGDGHGQEREGEIHQAGLGQQQRPGGCARQRGGDLHAV